MKLNKTTWAYKIYVFCYLITSKLFNKELASFGKNNPIPEHTNLCKLMRSAFIWTPIYFVILGGLIYGIGYSLFILPMTYGGAVGYFNVYVVPALFIGFAVLAGWMVSLI